MSDGTKPLSESILTRNQGGFVAFNSQQCHNNVVGSGVNLIRNIRSEITLNCDIWQESTSWLTVFHQCLSIYPIRQDSSHQCLGWTCVMMTSSNGKFSALLALCLENSSITGELPSQRPVTRSFDIFFDLRHNKRLSKQSRHRWIDTPWCSFWRDCNLMIYTIYILVISDKVLKSVKIQ